MLDSRFIFVEGIPGSGKTTTVDHLARHIARAGVSARPLWEDAPMRVALTLPHPHAVWRDVTVDQYIARSLRLWRDFLREAEQSPAVAVCDGMLFHGNMADLLLMDADPATLQTYVAQVLATLAPLRPAVIALRRDDLAAALRAICDIRGAEWESYQIGWKLASPYAQRRSLRGFAGWVHLYAGYRAICDDIFATLAVPSLAVSTTGDWPAHYRDIHAFLGLEAA